MEEIFVQIVVLYFTGALRKNWRQRGDRCKYMHWQRQVTYHLSNPVQVMYSVNWIVASIQSQSTSVQRMCSLFKADLLQFWLIMNWYLMPNILKYQLFSCDYTFNHSWFLLKLSSIFINCSWRDTMIGDDTKIDNLVQVWFPALVVRLFCPALWNGILLADRSQCSDRKVLHDLRTSRDCWFCNVCIPSSHWWMFIHLRCVIETFLSPF
jgi:hypothetical protein